MLRAFFLARRAGSVDANGCMPVLSWVDIVYARVVAVFAA
jgi:hypothetical protein